MALGVPRRQATTTLLSPGSKVGRLYRRTIPRHGKSSPRASRPSAPPGLAGGPQHSEPAQPRKRNTHPHSEYAGSTGDSQTDSSQSGGGRSENSSMTNNRSEEHTSE